MCRLNYVAAWMMNTFGYNKNALYFNASASVVCVISCHHVDWVLSRIAFIEENCRTYIVIVLYVFLTRGSTGRCNYIYRYICRYSNTSLNTFVNNCGWQFYACPVKGRV